MESVPSELYLTNDQIALEYGELAASRLTEERLAVFRESIHRSISNGGDNVDYQMWLQLIQSGREAVAAALTDRTERGQVLRSVLSFRAFASKSEREQIIRKFSQSRSSLSDAPR